MRLRQPSYGHTAYCCFVRKGGIDPVSEGVLDAQMKVVVFNMFLHWMVCVGMLRMDVQSPKHRYFYLNEYTVTDLYLEPFLQNIHKHEKTLLKGSKRTILRTSSSWRGILRSPSSSAMEGCS